MTQTPPKPTFEKTTNGRSSAVENQAFVTDSPSSPTLSPQATPVPLAKKPLESAGKTQHPEHSGISLRSQLLMTILPTVLLPLAVASTVGYIVINEGAQGRIKVQMQDQSLLIGKATRELLREAWKTPMMVANNPSVINAARAGSQQAEAANLQQLPIEQLEKRFTATKLLQPNQVLNDYLRRTAKIGGVAELFFTERNGLNIAYSNPTSDFVQRDEKWWQKGKSEGQWLAPLDFDESADTFSIDLIQAIADPTTGEFLGVIKSVLPSSKFDILATYVKQLRISKTLY